MRLSPSLLAFGRVCRGGKGNWSQHEDLLGVTQPQTACSPPLMPTTVRSPSRRLNTTFSFLASRKEHASLVHPVVFALGKKNSAMLVSPMGRAYSAPDGVLGSRSMGAFWPIIGCDMVYTLAGDRFSRCMNRRQCAMLVVYTRGSLISSLISFNI